MIIVKMEIRPKEIQYELHICESELRKIGSDLARLDNLSDESKSFLEYSGVKYVNKEEKPSEELGTLQQ